MKYKSYDCILCEKCDQKIYYYCYDCYDKETEELKILRSDLQVYEDFYCKLYDEETKELKELEKIYSILRGHKNIYSFKFSYERFPFRIENVLEQTMGIKIEIENTIIRIKKIIQDNQLLPKRHGLLEWISYNKFTNIKYIAEGGFSKVYSATWIDGPIKRWSQFSNNWIRKGSLLIALKVFNNSENINEDF